MVIGNDERGILANYSAKQIVYVEWDGPMYWTLALSYFIHYLDDDLSSASGCWVTSLKPIIRKDEIVDISHQYYSSIVAGVVVPSQS